MSNAMKSNAQDHVNGQAVSDATNVGRGLFFRRVLKKRCPQCGQGVLLQAYAKLAKECSYCGLLYRRESGGQTGSMYLSAAVTQCFAAIFVLTIGFALDWPLAKQLWVSIPLVALFCLLFMPWSMMLWVGVEYASDVSNGEPWAKPMIDGAAKPVTDSSAKS